MEAGAVHNRLMLALRERIAEERLPRTLYLGAGGCPVCPVCAKRTDEPCRHPELAVSSLEAYGVDVAAMAEEAGMRYINGENTVTYFGAVLFDVPPRPARWPCPAEGEAGAESAGSGYRERSLRRMTGSGGSSPRRSWERACVWPAGSRSSATAR